MYRVLRGPLGTESLRRVHRHVGQALGYFRGHIDGLGGFVHRWRPSRPSVPRQPFWPPSASP